MWHLAHHTIPASEFEGGKNENLGLWTLSGVCIPLSLKEDGSGIKKPELCSQV